MPKKKVNRKIEEGEKQESIEEAVLKNLISLQKINTDLAEKFDRLAKEISTLLGLFEVTAKNFSKHIALGEYEKDKEFLEKIDKLLDQNKTLAKGLTLMEERLRERVYGPQPLSPAGQSQPGMAQEQLEQKKKTQEEEFQPSILAPNRPLPRF